VDLNSASTAVGQNVTVETQFDLCFTVGQFIILSSNTSSSYLLGTVTSYSSTILSFDVSFKDGVDSPQDWNISLTGSPGPMGPTGPAGPVGNEYLSVSTSLTITGTNTIHGSGDDVFDGNTGTYWEATFTDTVNTQAGDAHWSNTKLLLQSDTTDGSQVFTDSSEKNHTVYRYGNTSHSDDQSKFGSSSIYLDGNADYLSVSHSTDFNIDHVDATIEFWWKHKAHSTSGHDVIGEDCIISKGRTNVQYHGWMFRLDSQGYLSFSLMDAFQGGASITSAVGMDDGNWHHIAVTRENATETWRLYVDGVKVAEVIDTAHNFDTNYDIWIGAGRKYSNDSIGYYGNFYIEDIRFTKGVRRYTANFTPPINTLPNSASSSIPLNSSFDNVVLLLKSEDSAGSTTFTDSSDFAHTITAHGDAKHITHTAKFGNSSIYFDKVQDFLQVTDSEDLRMGTEDFTWEFWLYWSSATSWQTVMSKGYIDSDGWAIQSDQNNTKLKLYLGGSTTPPGLMESTGASIGAWAHYAIVRNGTSWKIYRDGVETASATGTIDLASSDPLNIGATQWGFPAGEHELHGHLEELRITKGVARYTANFTVPTVPYSKEALQSVTPSLKVDFTESAKRKVTKYFFDVNDIEEFYTYMPKNWHLQASTNEVDWITLDTRINQSFLGGRFNYSLVNGTAYRYYRLLINEGNNTSSVKISEMNLVERK
jgi:hypothetical protein